MPRRVIGVMLLLGMRRGLLGKREHAKLWGVWSVSARLKSRWEWREMAKLVWRVKVVADLGSGVLSETEVARIERDDFAVPESVGLRLDEGKQLTAAIQAEIVRAQAAVLL